MTTRDASAIPARLAGGRRRKGPRANGGKSQGADNRGKGGR
ncbi:hypothetical protein HMPREF0972_00913 [Actinomyces sp. oral taxon 848 str. F0332]|nr:hypothetical protein HMPREF0972_00913 [Actinomyces sp. oral taxon 848 str. F0332]